MSEDRASKLSTKEHARRVGAWLEAEDDAAAAHRLGLEYAAFSQWRRLIGLPPKGQAPKKLELDVRTATWLLDRLRNVKDTAAGMESDLVKLLQEQKEHGVAS